MIDIYKVKIPCSLCGAEYDANVINGHIGYPHICDNCIMTMVQNHLLDLHERGIPICEELKPVVQKFLEDKDNG